MSEPTDLRSGVTVWAHWDGPVSPAARVAGLSLLARLLRQLRHVGVGKVVVVSEASDRVEALASEFPEGLSWEVRPLGTRPEGSLDATCLYDTKALETWVASGTGAPEPLQCARSSEDLQEMARFVWGTANKSLAHDGVVAYYVGRPLARVLSKALVESRVTPNQVTWASLLVGLLAAWVAARGSYLGFVFGSFLYWFGMVVDCVDGDLARVRLEGSRLGQWLDTIADDVSTAAYTAGMGFGLAVAGLGRPWTWVGGHASWWRVAGLVGGLGVLFGQAYVYRGLVRAHLAIDTALFPWFFLGEKGVVRTSWGLGDVASQLVRRDTSSAIYTVVCALGLPELVGFAAVVGGLFVFFLSLVDAMVKATSRRAATPSGRGPKRS